MVIRVGAGNSTPAQTGDADVVGLPNIHIEVKRRERLEIYSAIAQAVRDAKNGDKPAVFHRKNDCEWLVTMRLEDWMKLYGDRQ